MSREKDMLSALIRIGPLTAPEREAFESMWDQIHRGKLSAKQRAWIESVYYKLKLDQPGARAAKDVPASKTGFINDPSLKRSVTLVSMAQFKQTYPDMDPESSLYKRIAKFFTTGGARLEIRAEPKK